LSAVSIVNSIRKLALLAVIYNPISAEFGGYAIAPAGTILLTVSNPLIARATGTGLGLVNFADLAVSSINKAITADWQIIAEVFISYILPFG